MTPAEYVIEKYGSEKAVSDALGLHWTTPYNWRYRGGMIPVAQLQKILADARTRGIRIDPRRLINGAEN